jgi:polysaccharide pyruvyl transferase CsaB
VVTSAARIVISGYYGFNNSGDEAVLLSILQALQSESTKQGIAIEPIVLSIDPEWTRQTYGVQAVHRMKLGEVFKALRQSDGLISGGGSLLQDITSAMTIPYYLGILKLAQWMRKPTFIYAQGIGPVRRSAFHPFIRQAFRKCRYVSVRDIESAQLLQHMGLSRANIEVVPDPVMGFPLGNAHEEPQAIIKTRPVLGISVRYWNEDRSELIQLTKALQLIRDKLDVEIRFLPFHLPSDIEASKDVIRAMESQEHVSIKTEAVHPQQMLVEVSKCDLLIGMRLHSLIYAASQQIPMIGISYDPKIDQFLQLLELKAAATTEHFDADQLAEEALQLLGQGAKAEWINQKRRIIEQLQAEAQRPAQQIVNYLRIKDE